LDIYQFKTHIEAEKFMELYYKEYGSGHPFIILHGLFGMSDNWATLGRRFGEDHLVVTPDLRNHGRSPHVPEMDYPSMASDVHHFLVNQWIHSAFVMGHSMGGKVAVQLALDFPEQVEKLIVVDIGIHTYPSGHDEIFEAMINLPISEAKDRKFIENHLSSKIKDPGVVLFIMKNIVYDKLLDQYTWRMNLDTIHKDYTNILKGLDAQTTFDNPALFINGGLSRYVRDKDKTTIQRVFTNATFHTIEKAGHWVHADQPEELYQVVHDFLIG
jgi:esterase